MRQKDNKTYKYVYKNDFVKRMQIEHRQIKRRKNVKRCTVFFFRNDINF